MLLRNFYFFLTTAFLSFWKKKETANALTHRICRQRKKNCHAARTAITAVDAGGAS